MAQAFALRLLRLCPLLQEHARHATQRSGCGDVATSTDPAWKTRKQTARAHWEDFELSGQFCWDEHTTHSGMGTLVHQLGRCWAEAHSKIARETLTIKLDRNWSSFQLANSTPPLSVTGNAIAPSARIHQFSLAQSTLRVQIVDCTCVNFKLRAPRSTGS